MIPPATQLWRKLKTRQGRMLVYLAVLLGILAWRFVPRPWHPGLHAESRHYRIASSATAEQTEATDRTLELVYDAYSNRFGVLPHFKREHPPLKVKLFKDRAEFRWVNPGLGWAEAIYRKPYCLAYFSAAESHPYQWVVHESIHQLNGEVAQLKLEKWLEEGLAEYFSTSRLGSNCVALGQLETDTYPLWWLDEIATRSDLAENLRNGSVIPLRAIITNRGGPSLNDQFNLYYLHWLTLTHFVFEQLPFREQAMKLVESGGGLKGFEQLIGPVEEIQIKWHAHVRRLKGDLQMQAIAD